jgi:hypothetical protein
LALSGCASLVKEEHVLCPYDTVWDAAVDTMKDRPLDRKDKDRGVIETGWSEMAAEGRGFGVFGRDAFDQKERARMVLEVKRVGGAADISVSETRQRWHLRGGVTQQATKWHPIEPSQEAMDAVMLRLNNKLQERGCSAA